MSSDQIRAGLASLSAELQRREVADARRSKLDEAAAGFLTAVGDAVAAGLGAENALIHHYMPQAYIDWVATQGVDIVKTIPRYKAQLPDQPGYSHGELILYQGKVYKSLQDDNRFSPAAFPAGWEEMKGALNG